MYVKLFILLIFLLSAQIAASTELEPFFNKQVSNESIKSISVSPDGEYVAAASQDNYILFFDKNGSSIWNIKITEGILRGVATDGKDVAAGVSLGSKIERVRLYAGSNDILFDTQPEDVNFSSPIQHIAISGDRSAVVAADKNNVYILNNSGNITSRIQINGSITDVALSPNKELGAVSSGGTVYLFDVNGSVFADLKIDNNSVKSVSVSDTGYIAVLTKQTLYLYNNTQKLWERSANPADFFTSLSISPSGDLIAVTSIKEGLFLFDFDGIIAHQYPADFEYVSTDGKLIAAVKNTHLYLFNYTKFMTGTISVLSTQGSQVYLDNNLAGTVPITISGIPVGMHTIKIVKKDYETWVQNVTLLNDDKKEISIMLAPSIPEPSSILSQPSIPSPTLTQIPTSTPTLTPDVIVIPKNALYFTLLSAILIAMSGALYLRKRKTEPSDEHIKIETKNEPFIGGNCPYCGGLIKANSKITVCPDCETPHHLECWKKHGGCTTFGCKSAP